MVTFVSYDVTPKISWGINQTVDVIHLGHYIDSCHIAPESCITFTVVCLPYTPTAHQYLDVCTKALSEQRDISI